jgi:hypothetical protein
MLPKKGGVQICKSIRQAKTSLNKKTSDIRNTTRKHHSGACFFISTPDIIIKIICG